MGRHARQGLCCQNERKETEEWLKTRAARDVVHRAAAGRRIGPPAGSPAAVDPQLQRAWIFSNTSPTKPLRSPRRRLRRDWGEWQRISGARYFSRWTSRCRRSIENIACLANLLALLAAHIAIISWPAISFCSSGGNGPAAHGLTGKWFHSRLARSLL